MKSIDLHLFEEVYGC